MKYIVIELQTNIDGTVGNLVYAFDDRLQAQSKYHSILASAAISALPAHAAVIITSDGRLIESRCYEHVQPETEAEP